MRGRTVLILLILVIGLAAFIELYEHEIPSSEQRAALDKLVLRVEVDEITAVEITGEGNAVRLQREGDGDPWRWNLVEPLTAPADEGLVTSLIESLADLEKIRILDGVTPDDVGLNPPRLTVQLETPEGRAMMAVGSEVPAGNSMIVTHPGSHEILVVDSEIWSDLSRKPGDWRSRRVFEGTRDEIQRLVLKRQDRQLVLTKNGREFWVDTPLVDRADKAMVDDLLGSVVSMSVVAFADEWPEEVVDLGLDPPLGVVEIETTDGAASLRLEWGGPVSGSDSDYYARSAGQVFSTEADLAPYLEAEIDAWRSLELTSLETFQIDGMELIQADRDALDLRRDGAKWQRNDDEISFTTVSDLLYAVAGARAGSLVPEGAADLAASDPVLEIRLEAQEGQQTMTFLDVLEAGVPVVVSDRDVVLLLGQDEFTEILAKVEQVRGAESVKTQPGEQLPSSPSELSSDQ